MTILSRISFDSGRICVSQFFLHCPILFRTPLYDKDESLIKSPLSEISVDLLHEDYNRDHTNCSKLFDTLGLIYDPKQKKMAEKLVEMEAKLAKAVKQILEFEEETQKEKAEKERLKALLKENGIDPDLPNNNQVFSYFKVENIDDNINDYAIDNKSLKVQYPEDLANLPSNNRNSSDYINKGKKKANSSNFNSVLLDEETDVNWKKGERIAEEHLRKLYGNEIVNWNDEGSGKGYDFKRIVNGEEIAYYDVKTRQDKSKNSIKITKSQWDFATSLYGDKGQGEKYIILVVTLETDNGKPEIKPLPNPVKLWRDEHKLKAQPLELSWEDED